jgi:hypothetical protein
LIGTMLHQMHSLEYSIELDRAFRQNGGSRWRGKFNRELFQESDEHRARFASLNAKQRAAKMKELEGEYHDWIKKTQEVVTRRNRLLAMYKTVSP